MLLPASDPQVPGVHQLRESPAWLTRLDNVLGYLVEIPVALLVVAEVAILFSGIFARYILNTPLIWSDELASILFLWLAMLGAAVAFRHGEHMRMTALVNKASPKTRAFLDVFAVLASLVFVLLVLLPSVLATRDQAVITTPAMNLSLAWRTAALPVGLLFMGCFALIRLYKVSDYRMALKAMALILIIGLGLYLLSPMFEELGNYNLLIFFVGLVALGVFTGVPIAFAFGLATFAYLVLGTTVPVSVLVSRMNEGMSHLILLAVPLFVFLGLLIEMTSMAQKMVSFLASLLGHVRGGLSYVLVGAMYLVSGISGAKAADMAAIAPVLFPEMKKRGADEGELVALLSAAGAQTETIPPSLVLITIGSVTSVSITALFTGGLLPSAVLGIMLCLVVWYRNRHEDLSGVVRSNAGEIFKGFIIALPALALPFVIRAAVVEGVATATEVSTIGIVYSCLIGLLVYRRFDFRRLYPMLIDTASLSGAILLIIGAATGMAWALTQSGFSSDLADFMATLPGGGVTFLCVSIVTFILLGSVLEGIPAIVLLGPLLFPIAEELHINDVHYAMVAVLSMGIGLFAPPFGVGYYAACAIGRVAPDKGIKPIIGYLCSIAVGLIIVAAFPWLSTGFLK
ncbi:TRAP transporter large permease subunit [Paralcaligenes ureilyticus]|uniref:Tripartite ATP-independent transporter DctM subunit n=1 Tax=Paralcaligenes ureilyticus TaxID=627131 RepID=A0A4R3M3B1_9BURK|nr:TRAP transporter large permease subunit [Paralcaligenes ureilyticus]TCT05777.1 tripartite ATP-independent transporter DctM subunit [Paralcaligenes ureilyticus]